MELRVEPGYEPLAGIMQKALDQAQHGKGKERHANERPFVNQTLMNNTRAVGCGYPCGQAMKKAEELHGMVQRGEYAQAIEEAYGAAVYLLAAAMWIQEVSGMMGDEPQPCPKCDGTGNTFYTRKIQGGLDFVSCPKCEGTGEA